jgi:hypothetical protein
VTGDRDEEQLEPGDEAPPEELSAAKVFEGDEVPETREWLTQG